jgi:hypothetical protein
MSSKNREREEPPLPVTPILLQRGFSYRLGHFGEECSRLFLFPPFSFTFFPKREREKKKSEKKNNAGNGPNVSQREQITYTLVPSHATLPSLVAVPFVLQARDEKTAHQGKVFELCVWTHKKRSLSLPLNPFLVLKLCFGDSALGVSSFCVLVYFLGKRRRKKIRKFSFFSSL